MPLADNERVHFEVQVVGSMPALGGDAQLTYNTFHYERSTFVNELDVAAALVAFSLKVKASWLAFANENWSWDKIRARCMDAYSEPWYELAEQADGGVVGDLKTSMLAGVISKKSALRGKSYNGRTYIAGITEEDTTGNALIAGAKTRLQTLATKLKETVTDLTPNTFIPCILSRVHSVFIEGQEDIVMTQMISATARGILGSQQQRRSRVTS